MQNEEQFYNQAFQRNIGLLTEKEQKKLANCTVAIVGMGGVGGFHLTTLARLGVGSFHIADMDSFEIANIQRQCGASLDTMGKNKCDVMADMVKAINPHVKIKKFNQGISKDNVDDFINGADLFIDGIDFFSFDERRMIFKEAYEKGIYAITAGPLGFSSAMIIFDPKGMSFDQYFDVNDNMSRIEKLVSFAVGLAPSSLHMGYIDLKKVSLKNKKGPSLASACLLCAALASTEAVSILTERKKPKAAPCYFQFDPFVQKYKAGHLLFANKNPWQKLKRWFLVNKFSKE